MKSYCFFITLCLCLIACTDGTNDGPGRNACEAFDSRTVRIVDGTSCPVQNSPVVEITLLAESGGIGICSGTLIAPRFVLTAAHCFDAGEDDNIISSAVRVEGRDIEMKTVYVHPAVNLPQNDVAIIELAKPLAVPPVPLLLSEVSTPETIIAIFGYGFDENSNFAHLRSGEMEITGVTSQNVFARFSGIGSNICFGDSGGPALRRHSNGQLGIIGVTSFASSEGCVDDSFAAFANIQGNAILDFILDVVPDVDVL